MPSANTSQTQNMLQTTQELSPVVRLQERKPFFLCGFAKAKEIEMHEFKGQC